MLRHCHVHLCRLLILYIHTKMCAHCVEFSPYIPANFLHDHYSDCLLVITFHPSKAYIVNYHAPIIASSLSPFLQLDHSPSLHTMSVNPQIYVFL